MQYIANLIPAFFRFFRINQFNGSKKSILHKLNKFTYTKQKNRYNRRYVRAKINVNNLRNQY